MKNVRFVGLDVHAQTIAVAVAESGGEVSGLGVIPNRPESVSKLIKRLGKPWAATDSDDTTLSLIASAAKGLD
jgi:hypothetical protein